MFYEKKGGREAKRMNSQVTKIGIYNDRHTQTDIQTQTEGNVN